MTDAELQEAMAKLWTEMEHIPKPDFILVSRPNFKALQRYWRSKRKGKYPWVEITEAMRVNLAIPEKSAPLVNEWWDNSRRRVDKRCLRRYIRRAGRRYSWSEEYVGMGCAPGELEWNL